jgi:hypothetical protein
MLHYSTANFLAVRIFRIPYCACCMPYCNEFSLVWSKRTRYAIQHMENSISTACAVRYTENSLVRHARYGIRKIRTAKKSTVPHSKTEYGVKNQSLQHGGGVAHEKGVGTGGVAHEGGPSPPYATPPSPPSPLALLSPPCAAHGGESDVAHGEGSGGGNPSSLLVM